MRVYVAGPYTKGDVVLNVRAAITAGEQLLRAGHTPFIPHLNHFWHLLYPGSVEQWYAWDLEWLKQCDALVRLPGESVGADREVRQAKAWGIPTFYTVRAFLDMIPFLDIPRKERFNEATGKFSIYISRT